MRSVETIQDNLKRGIVDLVILNMLLEEDMYPYQIYQEAMRRSDGQMKVLVNSMYAPLKRMLDNGEISERRVMVGERRFRNYYHLEKSGYAYLALLQREYDNLMAGIRQIIAKAKKGGQNNGTEGTA